MVPLSATESLSVETAGRGEPLVLIPGLFGSAFGFRSVVPLLNAAGYRTIVVEPLGIGSSGGARKAKQRPPPPAGRARAAARRAPHPHPRGPVPPRGGAAG